MPERFRTRPAEVTAVRWTGTNCAELYAFRGWPHPDREHDHAYVTRMAGLDGRFGVLEPGDWLVRHDERRYEVLTDDEFNAQFEAVPVPTKPTLDPADPIINLDLTIRTYNRLRRDGIDTVGQLAGSTADKLMDIRGFGIGCLNDVVARLGAHGFKLAGAGVAHHG